MKKLLLLDNQKRSDSPPSVQTHVMGIEENRSRKAEQSEVVRTHHFC